MWDWDHFLFGKFKYGESKLMAEVIFLSSCAASFLLCFSSFFTSQFGSRFKGVLFLLGVNNEHRTPFGSPYAVLIISVTGVDFVAPHRPSSPLPCILYCPLDWIFKDYALAVLVLCSPPTPTPSVHCYQGPSGVSFVQRL